MSEEKLPGTRGMPLDGLLVLDLGRGYPGSYAAMFLGDFGAQVIRVDPPTSLASSPALKELNTEKFAAHYAPYRNKRGIVVNLKSEKGREIFCRLAKKADVVIEGFRPGVMERLKVGYTVLKGMNPRLIYCSLTGFGVDGPYAGRPGHDMDYCAIAGVQSLIGERNGQPYFASNYLGDMAGAGLHAVIGILLALAAREKTGKGQFVDVAYVDGILSLATYDISRYFATGEVPRRGESPLTGGAVWAQCFKCKDGEYFTIAPAEPHLWENLCRALGREDLLPYQYAGPPKRDEVITDLAKVFLTRTRDEWWEFFKDKDTAAGPVYYLNESLASPQVIHRKMVVEINHPKLGKVRQVGIPIKLSDTPGEIRNLGTISGAATEEIMLELGYSRQDVKRLREAGIIECPSHEKAY